MNRVHKAHDQVTLNPLYKKHNPLLKKAKPARSVKYKPVVNVEDTSAGPMTLQSVKATSATSSAQSLQPPPTFRSVSSSSDLTEEKKDKPEVTASATPDRFVKRLRHRSISTTLTKLDSMGFTVPEIMKFKPEKNLGHSLNNVPRPVFSSVLNEHVPVPEYSTNHSKNIKYREDIKCLVAATLEGLIEFSTPGMSTTLTQLSKFSLHLFVTHLQFLDDSSKLLDVIIARYLEISNSGPNPDKVILSRTIKLIKTWIKEQPQDFEDKKLKGTFEEFIKTLESCENSKIWADQLRDSLNELEEKEDFFPVNPPRSLVPKKMNSQLLEFSDLPTLEVARQLTLLEFEIFQKIKPKELVRKAWTRHNKEEVAPNIVSLINRFNMVSFWICYEIIKTQDLSRRCAMLCRFISLCEDMKGLRNFHGMMTIISALNNSSVTRLKNTWKEVPPKTLQMLKEHETLMSAEGSYKNYRMLLSQNNTDSSHILPTFPFEGVFLTDLTFIDENEDYKEENFVNWEKMSLLGEVILPLQAAQKVNYHLEMIPPLQQYLKKGLVCLDNDKLYKLSRQCEPPASSPNPAVISSPHFSKSTANLVPPSPPTSNPLPISTNKHLGIGSCIAHPNRIQKPSTSNPIMTPVSLDLGSPASLPSSPPSSSPTSSPFYSPPFVLSTRRKTISGPKIITSREMSERALAHN